MAEYAPFIRVYQAGRFQILQLREGMKSPDYQVIGSAVEEYWADEIIRALTLRHTPPTPTREPADG